MVPDSNERLSPMLGPWRDRNTVGGTYRLRGLIGQGGMSFVYLAHDEAQDRDAAIKVPRHRWLDEERRQHFIREAMLWAGLTHPHIVEVYHVADDPTTAHIPAIFMQYCDAGSLAELLSRGQLALRESLEITVQVCWAMAYAHGRNCVHRDLKPLNILLDRRGRAYVADFGLGREIRVRKRSEPSAKSPPRVIAGTPPYIAPEQWRKGARANPHSDVYSFGITLFEMLCGRLPLEGRNAKEWKDSHRQVRPIDPCSLNPQISPQLGQLILGCLAKSAKDRPQSFTELQHRLMNVWDQSVGDDFPHLAPDEIGPAPGRPARQGETLMALGLSCEKRGHYQEAKQHYIAACELLQREGDEEPLTQCHLSLGTACLRLREFDAAEKHFVVAQRLTTTEPRYRSAIKLGLGAIKQERQHYDAAEQLYREALQDSQAARDRIGEADSYRNLGAVQALRRDFDAAEVSLRQAAKISEGLGMKGMQATCYHNLGVNLLERNDHSAAIRMLEQAHVILQEQGSRDFLAACCINMAKAYQHLGNEDKAIDMLEDALHEYAVLGDFAGIVNPFHQLLGFYAQREDNEAAKRLLEEMRPVCRERGESGLLMFCCLSLGDLYSRQKDNRKSISAFEEALSQAEILDDKLMVMHCFLYLTKLYSGARKKERLLNRVVERLGHEGMAQYAMELMTSAQQGKYPGFSED